MFVVYCGAMQPKPPNKVCPDCKNKMSLLLVGYVCDACGCDRWTDPVYGYTTVDNVWLESFKLSYIPAGTPVHMYTTKKEALEVYKQYPVYLPIKVDVTREPDLTWSAIGHERVYMLTVDLPFKLIEV